MSCGIYKISNKLNQKFYIGKSINIEKRWRDHKKDTDSCPIHVAMQKYGPDQFELSILELCDAAELGERETYWIDYYNAYESDDAYNATRGGDGASHPIKLSHKQVLEIVSLLKNSAMTRRDIATKFGVSTNTISNINLGKSRILPGETYPIRDVADNPVNLIGIKFNIDSNELKKLLDSTQGDFNEIARQFNVSHMTIRQRCKEFGFSTNRSDYGYIDAQSYHSKPVWQCDVNTRKKLQRFDSIRKAARYMECSYGAIFNAISNGRISKGYYWIVE